MKLKRFKEKNKKKIGIILFTITCILLISGVILYRTFAIFETNDHFNVINGIIEDEGNIRFMVYVDNELQKNVPNKESGYSLDTSTSYCENGEVVSWNDEKWSVEIKEVSTTKTKCYLYFKKIYKESILNGAIPDFGNGRLIPITISDSEKPSDVNYTNNENKYGGKVYKADITTTWYSYTDKKWANAIILKDGETDHYTPGQEIPESNIESYFVWIPRYSYKLQDEESTFNNYSNVTDKGEVLNISDFYKEIGGNKGENNGFEIEFGTKDKEISNELLGKGSSIVHPAFEVFNSNGMWIGKFETGYNQNNDGSVMPTNNWTSAGAQKNTQELDKIVIKPSIYSWRSIQVSNAFYTSYDYIRELESHMMKNIEWGAVAYLTQSKYGRCDENNNNCSEVRINNSESHITGMAANFEPTCGYGTKESCNWYEETSLNTDGEKVQNYYNKESVVASTTGNYYGVYDMAGGAWEYVMGVMQGTDSETKNPASGPNSTNTSGFNGPYSKCIENGGIENCNGQTKKTDGVDWPSSKYYDLYDYSKGHNEYYKGKLGDATKEMGPFYSVKYNHLADSINVGSYNLDAAPFLNPANSWFMRGGMYSWGTMAGVFAYVDGSGIPYNEGTFRIILTP